VSSAELTPNPRFGRGNRGLSSGFAGERKVGSRIRCAWILKENVELGSWVSHEDGEAELIDVVIGVQIGRT
jgi:hypothetical protein